jgi:hypothetical protein
VSRLAAFAAPLLALASCQSSAPYTLPAAIINTTVAVGVALAQRASGGCVATCTSGTVCNPRTGLCEKAEKVEVCRPDGQGGVVCAPAADLATQSQASPWVDLPDNLRVVPATPPAPPPPAESSPGRP